MTKRQCQNSTQLIKSMIPHPTWFGFSHSKTEIKYPIDKKWYEKFIYSAEYKNVKSMDENALVNYMNKHSNEIYTIRNFLGSKHASEDHSFLFMIKSLIPNSCVAGSIQFKIDHRISEEKIKLAEMAQMDILIKLCADILNLLKNNKLHMFENRARILCDIMQHVNDNRLFYAVGRMCFDAEDFIISVRSVKITTIYAKMRNIWRLSLRKFLGKISNIDLIVLVHYSGLSDNYSRYLYILQYAVNQETIEEDIVSWVEDDDILDMYDYFEKPKNIDVNDYIDVSYSAENLSTLDTCKKTDIILIPVQIGSKSMCGTHGHVNVIIIDAKNNTGHYFEPHMIMPNEFIVNNVKNYFPQYEWTFSGNFVALCPRLQGIDTLCQSWILLFSLLCAINPSINYDDIYTFFNDNKYQKYFLVFLFMSYVHETFHQELYTYMRFVENRNKYITDELNK